MEELPQAFPQMTESIHPHAPDATFENALTATNNRTTTMQ